LQKISYSIVKNNLYIVSERVENMRKRIERINIVFRTNSNNLTDN
jgi:hypothetical protein